jgi:hypothetical protein
MHSMVVIHFYAKELDSVLGLLRANYAEHNLVELKNGNIRRTTISR